MPAPSEDNVKMCQINGILMVCNVLAKRPGKLLVQPLAQQDTLFSVSDLKIPSNDGAVHPRSHLYEVARAGGYRLVS